MKTLSAFIVSLLVLSFLFLSLPERGYSQELGCCFDTVGQGSCSGCEGLACAISLDNCQNNFPQSMFSEGSICFEGACSDQQTAGCCFIPGGECKQVVSLNACETVEGGIGFFAGAACNQVPGCSNPSPGPGPGGSEVSNVPTLSEWGLIAMAGVLGVIGFMVMRRRTASAGN